MPRKVPLMSKAQLEMLERLDNGEVIKWTSTTRNQSRSLKSLVNRGLAEVHGLNDVGGYCKDTYWVLKTKSR